MPQAVAIAAKVDAGSRVGLLHAGLAIVFVIEHHEEEVLRLRRRGGGERAHAHQHLAVAGDAPTRAGAAPARGRRPAAPRRPCRPTAGSSPGRSPAPLRPRPARQGRRSPAGRRRSAAARSPPGGASSRAFSPIVVPSPRAAPRKPWRRGRAGRSARRTGGKVPQARRGAASSQAPRPPAVSPTSHHAHGLQHARRGLAHRDLPRIELAPFAAHGHQHQQRRAAGAAGTAC